MLHILTLTYLQDPDVVAAAKPAHVNWLREQVNEGRILIAGPQSTGGQGVVITADLSEKQVEDLISTDPWVDAHIVRYDRVSIHAKYLAPGVFTNPQHDDSVTLINVVLTNDIDTSIDALGDMVDYVAAAAEGFRGARLLTSVQSDTIVNVAQWDSEAHFNAIFEDPDFASRYETFSDTTESSRYRLYRTNRVISPAL